MIHFLTHLRFCQRSVGTPWPCSMWYQVDRSAWGWGPVLTNGFQSRMLVTGRSAGASVRPVSAAWASSQHCGWIPRASVHRGPDRSTRHIMTLSQESQHVTSAIGTFSWLKLSQRADSVWGKVTSISWWGAGKVKIVKASIIPCGLGNIVVATFGKTQSDTHANRDRMHSNSSLRG